VRSRAGRSGKPAPVSLDPDDPNAAYAEAVKRLARQPQARAALAQKLARAGFTEQAVGAALDRAQAEGYLDDRGYAESLVRRRAGTRGHGLIAQELRARGIGEPAVEPALAQLDAEAELDLALNLGRGLLRGRKLVDGQALLAYLGPRLARRGFGSGLAYKVCRRLADEWETARLFDTQNEHN
jgi:regulatory protein